MAMKFDKRMNYMSESRVSDGMGGWIKGSILVKEIDVFTTPVKAEIMLKEYGVVSTSTLKIFTKSELPVKDELGKKMTTHIESPDGTKYKILQMADLGKLRMLLVEVM